MIPACAELPLMLLFSIVCTDEDGNVVDLTIEQPAAIGLEPTLFGFRHGHGSNVDIVDDTDTEIQTSIQTSSSSSSSSSSSNDDDRDTDEQEHDDNSGGDDNEQLPNCDQVNGQRDKYPDCWDRQDEDENTGIATCRDGSEEEDWRNCD